MKFAHPDVVPAKKEKKSKRKAEPEPTKPEDRDLLVNLHTPERTDEPPVGIFLLLIFYLSYRYLN